jgi:hypothetical protein
MAITGRIKPPNSGLTTEAAEALKQSLPDEDIDGADAESDFILSGVNTLESPPFAETGDTIPEADYSDEPPKSRLRSEAKEPPEPKDASARPPSIAEWEDFFCRIVLRVLCDWYIQLAFRGIDEDLLSDREIDRLQLSDDERRRIGVPFAEISHKSKFMRKHGRMIVASGGAMDAIIAFGVWTARVNRIARKYKPKTVQGKMYERTGQNAPAAEGNWTSGSNGGRVPGDGFTIINPGS